MHVRQAITIAAPPATIMRYLVEPDKLVSWQSLLSKAEKITAGAVQNGTQFALELNLSAQFPQARRVLDELRFELVGEVVDYVAETQIGITGESAINALTMTFYCTPNAPGSALTRLQQETQLTFSHPVLQSFAPLARGLLKRQLKADLATLKALIEAEATGGD